LQIAQDLACQARLAPAKNILKRKIEILSSDEEGECRPKKQLAAMDIDITQKKLSSVHISNE